MLRMMIELAKAPWCTAEAEHNAGTPALMQPGSESKSNARHGFARFGVDTTTSVADASLAKHCGGPAGAHF